MKIMCLNGWGGKLHEELLPYLETTAPEILCLQEVVNSPETEKDWLTYRDGDHILPQRANFFRDVRRALPEHVAVFCPAAQGVLWDEARSVPSQWGLATFVHRSLPIVGQVQAFVHKDFSPSGYGEHPRSRSAHGFRVFDYNANRPVSVTHMHGLRDLNGKMDTPERLAQAQRLLNLSRQVSEPDDLKVICGDFNVEPDSQTLSILSQVGMFELVTGRGFNGTRNSHYKKPRRYADYMLINREQEVKSFDVIYNPEVSDHCPLILEL
ncbi:endonuclease/exonuclease/phosphatase family protein [uncultured Roseobacter sp.]|uniref:endonuclease/exonuclease/phosphatase family protein n=1 Tax=uncultured Roseobacter sp. TaxID=114847 RepID=UPI002628503F|nr:endonuclease/exonuclease/phosphatase family protein [uncultured Roseobacter sp.]